MQTSLVSRPSTSSGFSEPARNVVAALQGRVNTMNGHVRRSPAWAALTAQETPTEMIEAILREIMWSVVAYQPHTTEAGFRMLGRLPKFERRLMTSLMHHKAEEAEHGEWAKRDFALLGGDPARLKAPPSPATFAVAAVWARLAEIEDPYGYLGAEFLFECLTMQVVPDLVASLKARPNPPREVGFLVEHAVEDVKHTDLIAQWIANVLDADPTRGESMIRCLDHFASVYPLPVWGEALERATALGPVR
jgi:hypothetical protein